MGQGMRVLGIILCLAAFCKASPDVEVVDWTKVASETTMGGPINEKGLLPCNGECLCEHPIKPQVPYPKAISMNEVVIGFGKVTETSYCDVATQLQMKLEGSDSWVTMYNGPRKEVLLKKIPIDVQVSFRIRERNCNGVGPYSDELIMRTPSDRTRFPGPEAESKSSHHICLKWIGHGETPVSLEMRPISEDMSGFSPSWEIIFTGIGTQACAENLTSSTFHEFRLKFEDPEQEQPISDSTLVKTEAEVPDTPTQPYVTEATDNSLVIQWGKPISKRNRSPVQLYVVEAAVFVDVDGTAPTAEQAPVEEGGQGLYSHLTFYRVSQSQKMEVKINKLKPGKAYAIRVRAVNAVGESDPSPVLVATTKPSVPGAVEGISFISATSDSIRIAWSGADARGAPIIDYEVQMSPGGAEKDFFLVYKGVKNHTKAEGLDQQTFYGFRIRARNLAGFGSWSPQYNIRTPKTGEVATDEQLYQASKPMESAAATAAVAVASQALIQGQPDPSLRKEALISSQVHLQLLSSLKPQTPSRDPDPSLDDLTRPSSIGENDPSSESKNEIVEPVSADGSCDPREGCLQKDASLEFAPPCPGGCHVHSGQGFCLPSGECHCASGWKGDDCNTALCPDLGGEDCGGHGKCTAPNVCTCQPGFNSPDCTMLFSPMFRGKLQNETFHNSTSTINLTKNYPYPIPEGGVFNVSTLASLPEHVGVAHPKIRPGAKRKDLRVARASGTFFALPASPDFDFAADESFTISLWFRSTEFTISKGGSLVSHGPARNGPGYSLGVLRGGQLYCGVGSEIEPFRHENAPYAVTADSFTDEKFHHFACRYNGKRKLFNLLVDGNEVELAQPFPFTGGKISFFGELDFSGLPTPNVTAREYPLVIGARWDMEEEHFDGHINDIRFWRTARLFDEIRAGMWNPMSIAAPGLALYIPLSDCKSHHLTTLRWKEGKPQIVRYPNPFEECELVHHPLVSTPDGSTIA